MVMPLEVSSCFGIGKDYLSEMCVTKLFVFELVWFVVAMEAQNIEKFREVIQHLIVDTENGNNSGLLRAELTHALHSLGSSCNTSRAFRDSALRILIDEGYFKCNADILEQARTELFSALQLLDDAPAVAKVLMDLLEVSDEQRSVLLCFQLCFDLVMDSGNPGFVSRVAKELEKRTATPSTEESDTVSTTEALSKDVLEKYSKVQRILSGGFLGELNLQFLYKNSDSDPLVMSNLKRALEEKGGNRNSVLHNAAVITHAFLNAGTTNDSFLRDDLAWMRRANNWARFSATASLGIIHANHTSEAMTLLQPYLPTLENTNVSGYAEGGALYALGLIHASTSISTESRKTASDYLRQQLRSANTLSIDPMSHGAALGIGLAEFASKNIEVCDELKELLYTDSAVAGEAAGLALGLVLCGAGSTDSEEISEILAEIKNYACETQHEKIIRGISVGIALMYYQREEHADTIIAELKASRDPILRYGAMYTIAMAYVGTGNNSAVQQLLHSAVSDVNNDVRMASVIGLAFVLYKTPERVPQLVELLLDSFNSHVRYAACMAVGIAMAGSADTHSLSLLEPMLDDTVDFVRQGALIGTAFILMQSNGKTSATLRERINSTLTDKHMSTLTKMGAVLATGILDAGGRNVALQLGSTAPSGINFTSMSSVAGTMMFLQHWHWYPMMHMLSVSLNSSPTYIFGLNHDLNFPNAFEVQCNSKPSTFAYPKRLEERKEVTKRRVETVALSTTAKNKAREARKKKHGKDAMQIDNVKEDVEEKEKMDVDENKESSEEKKVKKQKEEEPLSFRVKNPSRVTSSQANVCCFDLDQRYVPINKKKPYGVIILFDSTPDEDEDVGKVKSPSAENEADPPEAFEWAPPGHVDYQEPLPIPLEEKNDDNETMDKEEDTNDASMS